MNFPQDGIEDHQVHKFIIDQENIHFAQPKKGEILFKDKAIVTSSFLFKAANVTASFPKYYTANYGNLLFLILKNTELTRVFDFYAKKIKKKS